MRSLFRSLSRYLLTLSISACCGCSNKDAAKQQAAVAPAPAPPATASTSFSRDIEPVLDRMCARAEGCHGDKPTLSIDLDLRPAAAYSQLVGKPAQARPGAMRVVAGDYDKSFLVAKLTGQLGPKEGKPMPLDANTGAPRVPSPIGTDYLEYVLKPWIQAGAPNN